ncbi:helix-turn-helix domain-containing protein [Sphingosinicella humi]|uniref:DNA-binding protein n=1 Tax=Allosphingosinicella humi TaxID=2068657 RepID=A0A2U2J4P7_9SPHN|nr:helix-turn-helix domain-containing protein [Sphingosinicella humi]PWG03298.1 DNA-binding protein [Sphingosinicella humi]
MTDLTLEAIRAVVREELGKPVSPWLDTEQAAAYLGSTPGTMKNWRATGHGPRYHLIQTRLVRYHVEDLDRFVRGER